MAEGPSPKAAAALHDLARLPNREIALATAKVVQRRLGVDLRLPRGQPAPPIHSRMAAKVARRVLAWAAQQDGDDPAAAGSRAEEPAWRAGYEMSTRRAAGARQLRRLTATRLASHHRTARSKSPP